MMFPNLIILKRVFSLNRIVFHRYFKPKMKELPCEIALNHFDQFYGSVFKNWPSIRLGLLCPHSYCAVINVFSNVKEIAESLEDSDVFNMRHMYNEDVIKSETLGELNKSVQSTKSQDNESEARESHMEQESDSLNQGFQMLNMNSCEQDYVPATKLINRDFDSPEDYTEFYDTNTNYNASLIKGDKILYPEHWQIYLCSRGKFKKFPPPRTDACGLLNYYLMDGASILPVLALDIKNGEEVGDLCASPGGKTLAILFGFKFGKLVCNDVSLSRLNKLKTVLHSYLPGTQDWSKRIHVSNVDVCDWNCFGSFDKILLDVPCTNDRLSVSKNANNIFSQKRFSERMELPQLQTNMLRAALQALKPGGTLVYSTCSLSPIQNDGIVHMALSKLSVDSPMTFSVVDLSDAFFPLRSMFHFSDNCKYGQLVVPFLPLNYGPLYISKIFRNK